MCGKHIHVRRGTCNGKRKGKRCEEGENMSSRVGCPPGIQKLLPTFDPSGEKRMYWHGRTLLVYKCFVETLNQNKLGKS